MGINEAIQNYCEITGRPAATLTVEEYLRFAKEFRNDQKECRQIDARPMHTENACKKESPTEEVEEAKIKEHVENKIQHEKRKEQRATAEKKEISEEEMLKFMRGVSG